MSSEKFELNQDDLDSLLERVGAALRQLANSQGEARKRTQQVRYFYQCYGSGIRCNYQSISGHKAVRLSAYHNYQLVVMNSPI